MTSRIRPRSRCWLALLAGVTMAVSPGLGAADAAPALPDGLTERIGGADRYETAARVAVEYPADTDVVYVASGELFPDALTARGGTADKPDADGDSAGTHAPVLLTRQGELPTATVDALKVLDPDEIRIVGGSARISTDVEAALKVFGKVTRLAGADRYETSAAVAATFPAELPVAYVATGQDYPDALVGGAVATRTGAPVLLTRGSKLSSATASALTELAPQAVVVLGGPAAVSDDALADITDIVPDTTRVFGSDRYGTAAAFAAGYPKDVDTVYVATGLSYPDALAGSALAGAEGSPLLLAADEVPDVTQEALDLLSPQGVTVLGGPAAVGDAVIKTIDGALPEWIDRVHLQLLSFNDYHGHIEPDQDGTLTAEQDPDQNKVGGATYLSSTLTGLRTGSRPDQSMTVTAGDMIGGSPFLSGIFHDEPSVETLNQMGLDVSSVGNHEFDEGTEELLRMQNGGCHPDDGCYFPDEPYPGADFPWLAANVIKKNGGDTLLPGTYVQEVAGVKVGFIGMTLEATPTLVRPSGVASVDFLDEVETANSAAVDLRDEGVESIVVLLHEGGFQTGDYSQCEGISGPIVEIAEDLDPSIDMVVTGHTHQPYVCKIPDPDGQPRLVTSANQYGRVVTESDVVLSRDSGDVVRADTSARNTVVLQREQDPEMDAIIAKWKDESDEVGGEVVGTVAEDILGSAGGDRAVETPLVDLIADAILWGTDDEGEGQAQISFMNVGGVRSDLLVDEITNGEQPGEITYAEAFAVSPFGNLLVSFDLTGAQVKDVLEQQFDPERGRELLALGVSEGFTYTWDADAPPGSKVSEMELDGEALEDETTYRVSTLSFLAEGGDSFTAFTEGTNSLGGPVDFENLVAFLRAHPELTGPEDRVNGF